jgi:RNA exonuclease 4
MNVVSYLTPITGLTKEAVDEYGVPVSDALVTLRSYLGPNAILVGQSITKDVQWLGLHEGLDYGSLIDLSGLFRAWNEQRKCWTNFSQDHVAKVWLRIEDRPTHDALTDASISMSLFNTYLSIQHDPASVQYMQASTLAAERTPSYAAVHGSIEGCW